MAVDWKWWWFGDPWERLISKQRGQIDNYPKEKANEQGDR